MEQDYHASQSKVDSLKRSLDEEKLKRTEVQAELNSTSNVLTVLKTKEKQLHSDYNRAQEEKKQMQETLSKLKRFVNCKHYMGKAGSQLLSLSVA